MKNKKNEEKLNQRIDSLEGELELYKEKTDELMYKHNAMVARINTLIAELNNVITVLNNKHQENYCFYVYFVNRV